MELWSDYEGKTLDGRFPLEQLIGPSGRSAAFLTKDAAGERAVIRVVETLNYEEEEILARWRTVAGLGQENLLGMREMGQTEMGGTPLVYALLEPTDAELEEALRERALTAEETKQIGTSLVKALLALHGAGLVHEHVEASYVMGAGEVVKLRSDCVREMPEGSEGAVARARDVRDLAVLLHRALTLRKEVSEMGVGPGLPAPFDAVVRDGMDGTWGLEEIGLAMEDRAPVVATPPRPDAAWKVAGAAGVPRVYTTDAGSGLGSGLGSGVGSGLGSGLGEVRGGAGLGAGRAETPEIARTRETSVDQVSRAGAVDSLAGVGEAVDRVRTAEPTAETGPRETGPPRVVGTRLVRTVEPLGESSGGLAAAVREGAPEEPGLGAFARRGEYGGGRPSAPDRIVVEPERVDGGMRRRLLLGGAGVAAVALAAFGVHACRSGPGAPSAGVPAAVVAPASGGAVGSAGGTSVPAAAEGSGARTGGIGAGGVGSAVRRGPGTGSGAVTAPGKAGQGDWRVVAYTFRGEKQAEHKARQIAERHGALRPQVFSPTGRAPYLVALGGWMSAEQATAVRAKARREGLARDVYMQNYRRGRGR